MLSVGTDIQTPWLRVGILPGKLQDTLWALLDSKQQNTSESYSDTRQHPGEGNMGTYGIENSSIGPSHLTNLVSFTENSLIDA